MKYQTRQFNTKTAQTGFTLIELIITLAIAAIILTQAVPSFGNMIVDNRLITQTNDLVADINIARSEAITRNAQVILCSSADPRAAGATCNGTANVWSTGWLLYVEEDGTAGFDSTGDDVLINIGQPSHASIAVNADASSLQYNADGTAASAAIFAICDDRLETNGRQLNVNATGRPRLTSGSLTAGACTPV